jgi:hypothetical protein
MVRKWCPGPGPGRSSEQGRTILLRCTMLHYVSCIVRAMLHCNILQTKKISPVVLDN